MIIGVISNTYIARVNEIVASVYDDEAKLESHIERSFTLGEYLSNKDNLSPDLLIVDENAFINNGKLIIDLQKARLLFKDTRIILIMDQQATIGEELYAKIVALGIYDIIPAHDLEDEGELLRQSLISKATYADAAKYLVETDTQTIKKQQKPTVITETKKIVEIQKEREIIGNVVIGVSGIMNRVGATFYSIKLAKCLADKQQKVAFLTSDEVFQGIIDTYEGITYLQDDSDAFIFQGINFYRNKTIGNVSIEKNKYIVWDCGHYVDVAENFKTTDLKIVVCCPNGWEIKRLEDDLIEVEEASVYNSFKYVFNFCDDDSFAWFEQNMPDWDIYQAEYQPSLFSYGKSIEKILCPVLVGNTPAPKKEKKRGKRKWLK